MHGAIAEFEAMLVPLLESLRLIAEAAAGFWIAVGVAYAIVMLSMAHIRRQTASFRAIRLLFSRYLSLALEFQLAADILGTAIAPTLDDLMQLAIIAVIRTGLNYFLMREMREEVESREHEARVSDRAEAPFHTAARTARA